MKRTENSVALSHSQKRRSWVWASSLNSRADRVVSLLACFEALAAVAFYWWLAFRFDTHWHLVSSVFVAPLLLMRSPQSIEAGVSWFLNDSLKMKDYLEWTPWKQRVWVGLCASLIGIVVFLAARYFAAMFTTKPLGGSLHLGVFALFGIGSVLMSVVLVVMSAGHVAGQGAGAVALGGPAAFAGAISATVALSLNVSLPVEIAVGALSAGGFACAIFCASRSSPAKNGALAAAGSPMKSAGTVVLALMAALVVIAAAAGLALRASVVRVATTLCHLFNGIQRIPENWNENSFLTDSLLPAELIPGIRVEKQEFSLDGIWAKIQQVSDWKLRWIVYPPVIALFFLPAFLYRLNIKSTAWFWWPLAYLLKPSPQLEESGAQKEALCWPWTNPWQKWLIVSSSIAVVASLLVHYVDLSIWHSMENLKAVSPAIKLLWAVDWKHCAPWHWALWIMEAAGIGMLIIAGNARSHAINDAWQAYVENGWRFKLGCMVTLQRIRTLATIAFLLMGLGALFVFHSGWHSAVQFPEKWIVSMKRFYGMP